MAIVSLGTAATNTLNAVAFSYGMSQTDIGDLNYMIRDDINPAHPRIPGAFASQGFLVIPNRGILRVLPGDYIGVGANNFPILLAGSVLATDWVHT